MSSVNYTHRVFDGHIDQVDFDAGQIHRLHLRDRGGKRIVVTIGPAEEPLPERLWGNNPLAILSAEMRPTVTIDEDWL